MAIERKTFWAISKRQQVHSFTAILLFTAQWAESFSKNLWFAIVFVFLAEMGRYLAAAGLNLLAQITYSLITTEQQINQIDGPSY